MDDAVSIKKTEKGYVLGVHIAHVSHYVKPGMALFEEALKRSTSVYFPNAVLPMLPHKLSNGICSLNPDVDRLARSIIIEFDENGEIINYRIAKSVIHSDKKMNYDDVENILSKGIIKNGYEPFVKDLRLMRELSEKLSLIKNNRGYIGFDSKELKFELDSLGNTKEIKVKSRKSSEEMIENFMLVPNHLVALYAGAKPFVYRNHPSPSYSRIQETILYLKELGYNLHNLDSMSNSMLIQKLLSLFKDKEEFIVISNMILRSLKLAYYGVENEGHFGLALEDGYIHFTSPIRRVPDLLDHTLIDLYEEKDLTEEDIEKLLALLKEYSSHASRMERMADKAEYEVDKVQVINYIKQHVGEHAEVFIEAINSSYIVVRSNGLLDGIIYFEDFNDDIYMLPSGNLKSKITGKIYKVGHKLEVEIKDASYKDKTIYYVLIDNLTLREVEKVKLQRALKASM